MKPIVFLGIVLCLLGAIGNNLGNNIQSLGMKCIPDGDENTARKQNRTWMIGTIVYVSGALLLFGSFGLAPASLLAPLESVQFVTNVLFGRIMLKRTVTPKMILGTCFIVAGTIIALLSGPHKDPEMTIEQLTANWQSTRWLVYVACMAGTTFVTWLVHKVYNFRFSRGRPLPGHKMVSPLTYAIFSAIIGTQSVVQAKCMAELVRLWTAEHEDIWKYGFTYLVVSLWIPLVAVWLHQLNKALGIYDPLFMIPLLQANFIFFAVLSGGVFFGEFDDLGEMQWVSFFGGVTVMFTGLYLLASASFAMEPEYLSFSHGLGSCSHMVTDASHHSVRSQTCSTQAEGNSKSQRHAKLLANQSGTGDTLKCSRHDIADGAVSPAGVTGGSAADFSLNEE